MDKSVKMSQICIEKIKRRIAFRGSVADFLVLCFQNNRQGSFFVEVLYDLLELIGNLNIML